MLLTYEYNLDPILFFYSFKLLTEIEVTFNYNALQWVSNFFHISSIINMCVH